MFEDGRKGKNWSVQESIQREDYRPRGQLTMHDFRRPKDHLEVTPVYI